MDVMDERVSMIFYFKMIDFQKDILPSNLYKSHLSRIQKLLVTQI